MSTSPSPKSAWALVIGCALLLAGGALYLAITQGDPVSPLFRHVLTIKLLLALLAWFAVAWAARRFTVGKMPNLQLNSAGVVWGGSRVALLIAVAMLLVGGLIALVLGLAVQTAFLRAMVLLVVVMAFTGIAGGAFLNSMLFIRHRLTQKAD